MKYTTKDVVMLKSGWSGATIPLVITGIKSNGSYECIAMGGTRRNVGVPEAAIAGKIGRLEDADLTNLFGNLNDGLEERNAQIAKNHAGMMQAFGSEREAAQWKILSNLKNGDELEIRINGKQEIIIFDRMLPRGQKYVFAAKNKRGTAYKYPASVVFVPKTTVTAG